MLALVYSNRVTFVLRSELPFAMNGRAGYQEAGSFIDKLLDLVEEGKQPHGSVSVTHLGAGPEAFSVFLWPPKALT